MAFTGTEADIQYLDEQLLENGKLKILPADVYRALPWLHLRIWMHWRGFYGIPTLELISFLKEMIIPEETIEIGAGRGDFCANLGIRGTDSKMQNWPEVKLYYMANGQPTVPYGEHVEELEAQAAIKKHQPKTVFGSWITQLGNEGQSSMYGVDEEELLKNVSRYILFGATSAHGQKRIIKRPHREVCAPWMISRAEAQNRRIYVWE